MKKLLLLFALSLFTACATINSGSYQSKLTNPTNQTLTKEIGSSVVSQVEGNLVKAIIITKGSKVKDQNFTYTPQPGQVYVNYAKEGENEYFYPENSIVNNIVTAKSGIAFKKRHPMYWTTSGMGWISYEFETPIEYNEDWRPAYNQKCYKKELLYNGKSGNTIKFSYREYVDDFARPAFTQDLQYDLNESTTIGFRGARIEIEKTSNTEITYKVLSGFTQ